MENEICVEVNRNDFAVEKLKDALSIMDEKGKNLGGDNMYGMWETYWNELRGDIFDALESLILEKI